MLALLTLHVLQGLPLSLSGVRKIMNMMDWGDIGEFVSFGEVGRDQIDKASYYILVAPQNVVGTTILTNLGDMVSAGNQRQFVHLIPGQQIQQSVCEMLTLLCEKIILARCLKMF